MDTPIRPITDADRFNTHDLFTDDDPPDEVPSAIKRPDTGRLIVSMCKRCRKWGEKLFEKSCDEWLGQP